MRNCYIFDIDGTLADLTHRLPHIQKEPKDWDAFFAACPEDKPIGHICDLARTLAEHHDIVCVSGRSDQVRAETEHWLEYVARVPVDKVIMRRQGDHRPDNIVKQELLAELRSGGMNPCMAFDDRNQVVEMWRSVGVPCAQVAPGDF